MAIAVCSLKSRHDFGAIATLSLESAESRPEKHNFVNLSCRKMIGESGAKTETVANRFEFKFN